MFNIVNQKFLKLILLILNVFIWFFSCYSQNEVPKIENVIVENDTLNNKITVYYDISDPENDTMSVEIKLRDRTTRQWVDRVSKVKGDVGYPILSGSNKQATISYEELEGQDVTAVLIADDHQYVNYELIGNTVDTLHLKNNVSSIYGIRHPETGADHLEKVRNYLEKNLISNKLMVIKQPFEYEGREGLNIIGHLPGVLDSTRRFVICAHYDSWHNSPGADDNASGIAGILEAMRVLSNYTFDYTIEFIAFDIEEAGAIGSQHYVANLGDDIDILGVLNLDMIGYYSNRPYSQQLPEELAGVFPEVYMTLKQNESRANFILNISTTYSRSLEEVFNESVEMYVPGVDVITLVADQDGEYIPALIASDNASFWQYNISALHIGEGGRTRNPNIDSPDDTIDLLNYRFMSDVTKGIAITAAQKAKIKHAAVYEVATK